MRSRFYLYWSICVFAIIILMYIGPRIPSKIYYTAEDKNFSRNNSDDKKEVTEKALFWTLATSSAEWRARDSAVSFVFQNKMWTMGGLNGDKEIVSNENVKYWESPHFNDIWSSENGINWTLEKSHAEWSPRRSMSVLFFKDKLWMFGGWSTVGGYKSDVWQSDDGIEWTKALTNAPWPAREGQTAEVLDGKMWIFGGVNYDTRETENDVWFSTNGIDWQKVAATAPWGSRWDHATAIFDGKIYLLGGMNLLGKTFNDVWSSSDGINWDLVTDNSLWQERQGHSLVVFDNKLWLIGRLDDVKNGGLNDLWYSKGGINWIKTEVDPPWLGREDHSVLVFDDKMFVFGGMDSNWKWRNDVWFLHN